MKSIINAQVLKKCAETLKFDFDSNIITVFIACIND